jgi:hypothetical protein
MLAYAIVITLLHTNFPSFVTNAQLLLQVSKNSIWREHVRKEDKKVRDTAPFQVSSGTNQPQ